VGPVFRLRWDKGPRVKEGIGRVDEPVELGFMHMWFVDRESVAIKVQTALAS